LYGAGENGKDEEEEEEEEEGTKGVAWNSR
jgi:hypothetical protein